MNEEWLKKSDTTAVRAIAAIGIMYTHLVFFSPVSNLIVLKDIGYLCVGIFFFYTGYNAICSYRTNGLRGYIVKKIKRVYLPLFVANQLMILFKYKTGAPPQKDLLLQHILGIRLINPTLWYVNCIIAFYIIFYLVFTLLRLLRKVKPLTNICDSKIVLLIAFTVVFLVYALVHPWASNKFGFYPNEKSQYPFPLLVGAIFALYKTQVETFLKKFKFQSLALLIPILLVAHSRNMEHMSIAVGPINLYDSLPPVLTAIIVNFYLYNETINSKVLNFIGTISYEIYLLHYILLSLFKSNLIPIKNDYLYVTVYTVTLIILAHLLHSICNLSFLPKREK